MKKISCFFAVLGMFTSMITFLSCSSDNDGPVVVYTNALVTVKPNADNTLVYLQLDDNTTLFPINMSKSPFGTKEVRALTNYTKSEGYVGPYTYGVNVNWIDSILTKPMVTNYGEDDNWKKYGSDEIEIVNDWVTVAEDGYLTLRFRTIWGNGAVHYVNLVYREDSNNPYTVQFYHNANGDKSGLMGDGMVAFKLDELPDTEGKTVDLTLQWKSYSGMKSTTFKYCTRKAYNTLSSDKLERVGNQNIQ